MMSRLMPTARRGFSATFRAPILAGSFFALASSCSRTPELPPVVAEETLYDFQDHFGDARIERANERRAPRPDSLFVGNKKTQLKEGGNRPALVLTPPAKLTYEVAIPDADCALRLSLGLAYEEGKKAPPTRYEVQIDGKTVLSEQLAPGPDGEPVDWKEAEIPLAAERGRRASVTFATSCAPDREADLADAGFAIAKVVRKTAYPRLAAAKDRMNVLFVLVDTTRADHVSCYGYPRPTTPNLDRLATEGALYARATSQASWTWPATASVLTSLYPRAHGVIGPDNCYLVDSIDTLAELFQKRGYATYGVSANALVCRAQNFNQGFETFEEAFREPAEKVTDRFAAWLQAHEKESFFAYLHYMDPHHPYTPPEDARQEIAPELFGPANQQNLEKISNGQKTMRTVQDLRDLRDLVVALYDAEIRHWDDEFGRVLDELKRRGLSDRTIVVVTADHGEEFWEHGHCGHAKTLFQELIHVPLVVWCPRLVKPARVDGLVETIDIFPTLCAAADVPVPPTIDGQRLPGISGIAPPARLRSEAFSQTSLSWENDAGNDLLFDLEGDPGETRSLLPQHAEEADRLARKLSEWLKSTQSRAPNNARPWNAKAINNQLNKLGYVDGKKGGPQEGMEFREQRAIVTPTLKLIEKEKK